jgi:hypothetical protein
MDLSFYNNNKQAHEQGITNTAPSKHRQPEIEHHHQLAAFHHMEASFHRQKRLVLVADIGLCK